MSRITHFKQPINIAFWDYYILCHLNSDAALALQRMEYWDGTKDNGNAHAEAINDEAMKAGQSPAQDTSNWIYKSQDELQWELQGIVGEKRLTKIINVLVDDLNYLKRRNNPLEGWDRRKQYEFQASLLQEQINYLGYIISFFNLPMRHLCPVFYAIEALTSEKIYIDALNVEKVIAKIEQLKIEPKIPHFLKGDLEKFEQVFIKPPARSFRTFAEWKAHFCGMHSAEVRNASSENAECIPQKCGSNNIEDTYRTNIEDKHRGSNSDVATANIDTPTSPFSLEMIQDWLTRASETEIQQVQQILLKGVSPASVGVSHDNSGKMASHEAASQANVNAIIAQDGQSGWPVNLASEPPNNDASVTQQSLMPDVAAPRQAKPRKPRTPRTPKGAEPPQMPSPDMVWSTRKCMMLFDAWRGARLIGYAVREASTCAKGLVEQYTEEQVVQVYKAMNAADYWKERGGADICNVAHNISREIKKIKSAQPKPETKAEPQYGLSQADFDALMAELSKELGTAPHIEKNDLCVKLYYGDGDNDYMAVRDMVDLQYWREEKKDLMEQAAVHAKRAKTYA